MALVVLYWSPVSPWTCLLTHRKWASQFSAAQLWHSYDVTVPIFHRCVFYLFFPSSPFSRSLSLSITCHAPAISRWPFSQTDGSCTNCAISTHVILFVQTDPLVFFFVSEMYLFNKWIFNLPVVDHFFLRVDVTKNHAKRDKQMPWKSGKVLVLFCSLVSELLMFMLKFETRPSQESFLSTKYNFMLLCIKLFSVMEKCWLS